MTVEELKDVIVYLQGRIEELEGKKLCECAEEPTKPTVTYVTNYDEDEDCIACSAYLYLGSIAVPDHANSLFLYGLVVPTGHV